MEKNEIAQLIVDGAYSEAAFNLLMNYVGENYRKFEKDDLEGRGRILELQLHDWVGALTREELKEDVRDKGKIVEGIIGKAEEALKVIVRDNEIAIEEIASEEEDLDTGVPIYKIASYPSDPTLEGLYVKRQRGEIIVPRFQRGWVWSATQASRLVESFLLGLPVPSIFVCKEASGKQVVIDGQQRLRTIWGFFDGVLPDGSPFYLRGVGSEWNELLYKDLRETDKIRFRDSILRVVIVEQINPADTTSIYHIFERLNTGGTGLTPQEVRNCSYHGAFNDMLFEINQYETWRKVFGVNRVDARMRDLELIVRFFALNEGSYEKPMKRFLNLFMGTHKRDSTTQIDGYAKMFKDVIDKVYASLGAKPFHIRRGINVAVFDSVVVAFAKGKKIPSDIMRRYQRLLTNKDYIDTVTAHTTDTDTVKQRLALAQKVLFGERKR